MTHKTLQIKLNRLLLKEPTSHTKRVQIMLSSSNKLLRLKSSRIVRNGFANLFGQSFCFNLDTLPITIIVVKVNLNLSETQLGRFRIGKDVIKLGRKIMGNMVSENQAGILKWECRVVDQDGISILGDRQDHQDHEHNLDDIDQPDLASRALLRNFSELQLTKIPHNQSMSHQSILIKSHLKLDFNTQSTLNRSKLRHRTDTDQHNYVRRVQTSRKKDLKTAQKNLSQQIPGKSLPKKLPVKKQSSISTETTNSTKSKKNKTNRLHQLLYATAFGMISGLVAAVSVC